jgi:hypothetical protein
MKRLLLFMAFIAVCDSTLSQVYSGQKGVVKLAGDAPQEIITAVSNSLVGKLDLTSMRFNFRQAMNAFTFSQGDLQKKHAEETFWETNRYPNATFSGEIINDTDLSKDGVYPVTVRGKFSLHGIEKELKMPAMMTVQNGAIAIACKFSVFLSDYKIKIPRLVSTKVAPEFTVDVQLNLTEVNRR